MSINPSQSEDLEYIDSLLSSMDPGNVLNIKLVGVNVLASPLFIDMYDS